MRSFYSCVDTLLTTPQPEQLNLSRQKAKLEGGEMVFYGSEEYKYIDKQPFILNKLLRTPGITDVVFFSFDQFCYGERLNFKLLFNIIESGFGVHFARENLSFYDVKSVRDNFSLLSAYFHALKRKRTPEVKQVLRSILG
jgi:hypothetical protein